MRVRRVPIGSTWLQFVLRGHDYSRMVTDWPEDAVVTFADWSPDRGSITLTVLSETFDDVPEGHVIPQWSPTITLYMDETAQLLDLVRRGMDEND